jgi:hypothetical protein
VSGAALFYGLVLKVASRSGRGYLEQVLLATDVKGSDEDDDGPPPCYLLDSFERMMRFSKPAAVVKRCRRWSQQSFQAVESDEEMAKTLAAGGALPKPTQNRYSGRRYRNATDPGSRFGGN